MRDNEQRRPEAEADGIIEGRNAVIEALRAGTTVDKIYLAKGETDKTLGHIASKARAQGIVVVEADRRKLDGMSRTHAHQGVIALAAVREYVTVQSLLDAAAAKGEPPLLVVCDEISDPHNLGAILRTAECAGAHGVIIPKRRSAGLTAIVAKTSAGAVSYMPVARVAKIPSLLKDLKKQGIWVFGTAASAYAILPGLMMSQVPGLEVGISGLLCVVALGCGVAVQKLAARVDSPRSARGVVAALAVTVPAMCLAAVAVGLHSLPWAFVAAAALGTAYGMLLVGGLREIQRIAGPDDLAGLTAVYYSLTYLGFFIPAILAALGAWITYSAMFLAGSLIAALSLGVVAMSGRRHLPTG